MRSTEPARSKPMGPGEGERLQVNVRDVTTPGREVAVTAEVGRVIVLAVDGATWNVLDPMMEEGYLPTLTGLKERGCWGTMTSLRSSRSAVIWTSIATGMPPEVHGIVDFSYEEAGERRLYLNDKLLSTPLWELASEGGASVGVTHWWVTYPAVPVNGYLISDHAIFSASRLAARTFTGATDALPREAAALVYPPELWDAVRPVLKERLPTHNDPLLMAAIDDTFAQDAEVVDMTLRASKAFQPRLQMVYLKGVDMLSHYLWGFFRPGDVTAESPPPKPRDVALYEPLIPAKYSHTDALIGELLADLQPQDVVIVLSDHGFGGRSKCDQVDCDQFARGFHRGTHGVQSNPFSRDGIFVIAGGPISGKSCPDRISLYDVAPTVLYLLGQPIPKYMGGHPVLAMTDPAFKKSHPLPPGSDRPPERAARPTLNPELDEAERQRIEGLRVLGYLEPD